MIIELFNFPLSYYGLVYVFGFFVFFLFTKRKQIFTIDNINTAVYLAIGVIVGGRSLYVLLYEPTYYLSHLSEIYKIYLGGMSYHGGVIGGILSLYFINKKSFLYNLDRLCKSALIVIPFGRLANFFNGELFGRITDLPFGIMFEGGGPVYRHPSQLYEMIGEGPILFFVILFILNKLRKKRIKILSGMFACLYIIFYSVIRFLIEFTRQPDAFLGFVDPFNMLSLGQVLCLIYLVFGLLFFKKLMRVLKR